MMKTCIVLSFLALASEGLYAFVSQSHHHPLQTRNLALNMAYVPDGFTPEQWKKLKQQEQDQRQKKKFGAFGPQGFKSRSLQSFQEDLEKGKADHLMPVFNAKDKVKKGEIKAEDVPYMQRGGSWDNTDVKGAKKKEWNSSDKKYEAATARSRGSPNFDWTGTQARKGGPQQATTTTSAAAKTKSSTKKLFGLWP